VDVAVVSLDVVSLPVVVVEVAVVSLDVVSLPVVVVEVAVVSLVVVDAVDDVGETAVVVGTGHGVEGLVDGIVCVVVVLCVFVVDIGVVVEVADVVELSVVVVVIVELPVTSVHCASSTLPPGPPQANGNFCVQVNTHVPALHVGISNVPSGIS
jgi:hypothetical protein